MKVIITKDQPLKDAPEFAVLDASGKYEEEELITVYKVGDAEKKPYSMFEARFVAEGESTYSE